MAYKNPEDQKKYHAIWYQQNKTKVMEQQKASKKERADRNREFVQEYKSNTPCMDCGNTYHFSAMDFHHTGKKNRGIARLVNDLASIKKILDEIALCDLICSNCHRIRHWIKFRASVAE